MCPSSMDRGGLTRCRSRCLPLRLLRVDPLVEPPGPFGSGGSSSFLSCALVFLVRYCQSLPAGVHRRQTPPGLLRGLLHGQLPHQFILFRCPHLRSWNHRPAPSMRPAHPGPRRFAVVRPTPGLVHSLQDVRRPGLALACFGDLAASLQVAGLGVSLRPCLDGPRLLVVLAMKAARAFRGDSNAQQASARIGQVRTLTLVANSRRRLAGRSLGKIGPWEEVNPDS